MVQYVDYWKRQTEESRETTALFMVTAVAVCMLARRCAMRWPILGRLLFASVAALVVVAAWYMYLGLSYGPTQLAGLEAMWQLIMPVFEEVSFLSMTTAPAPSPKSIVV